MAAGRGRVVDHHLGGATMTIVSPLTPPPAPGGLHCDHLRASAPDDRAPLARAPRLGSTDARSRSGRATPSG